MASNRFSLRGSTQTFEPTSEEDEAYNSRSDNSALIDNASRNVLSMNTEDARVRRILTSGNEGLLMNYIQRILTSV